MLVQSGVIRAMASAPDSLGSLSRIFRCGLPTQLDWWAATRGGCSRFTNVHLRFLKDDIGKLNQHQSIIKTTLITERITGLFCLRCMQLRRAGDRLCATTPVGSTQLRFIQ